MKLTVDGLRENGGFTGAPVKREVEWTVSGNTYKADVYVRKLSYSTAISDASAVIGGGDFAAARIAHCIVDEKGEPIFKVSDITGINEDGSPVLDESGEPRGQLNDSLGTALLVIISEVNGLGKTKGES